MTITRRSKEWWKWYYDRLNDLAKEAAHLAKIVSDGDPDLMAQAVRDVKIRHYWLDAGVNAKGQDVFFCWSIHKDSSGHFRTWREVHTQEKIKRYNMTFKRSKKIAARLARERHAAFKGKYVQSDDPRYDEVQEVVDGIA